LTCTINADKSFDFVLTGFAHLVAAVSFNHNCGAQMQKVFSNIAKVNSRRFASTETAHLAISVPASPEGFKLR